MTHPVSIYIGIFPRHVYQTIFPRSSHTTRQIRPDRLGLGNRGRCHKSSQFPCHHRCAASVSGQPLIRLAISGCGLAQYSSDSTFYIVKNSAIGFHRILHKSDEMDTFAQRIRFPGRGPNLRKYKPLAMGCFATHIHLSS